MTKITYRAKVDTREELLQQIMNAASYIREHPEMLHRAVNSCLKLARLCIEIVADILNHYKMYRINCSNKFIWYIFPARLGTVVAPHVLTFFTQNDLPNHHRDGCETVCLNDLTTLLFTPWKRVGT
jgi:hypothetical protein